MMRIEVIYKKEAPKLLNNTAFWNHTFFATTKHRLYAHYKNPNANDNDVILLLAYLDEESFGYMGVFNDIISIHGKLNKIGWLSTWWVYPKTKGTGIAREILNEMHGGVKGKIGISQFTPSAKRVYDKSGFFVDLKVNKGIKAVLRSNLAFVLPAFFEKTRMLVPLFNLADKAINFFVNIKLKIQKVGIRNRLQEIKLEYVVTIDQETLTIIDAFSQNHISPKNAAFFEWLKTYFWVQEAPLLRNTEKSKYEFSSFDDTFNIYLIKIIKNNNCIGFLVLQKRNYVMKLLFAYYDSALYSKVLADIILLQSITQNVREIIYYDENIKLEFSKSSAFLYRTKKTKQAIISKDFNVTNFEDEIVNFGDGDCSFA